MLSFSVACSGVAAIDKPNFEASIVALEDAWRSGDGAAWSAQFTEDAFFTVWFGLRLTGREPIASGHQMIFDSFYAGTEIDLKIVDVRLLGDDVALARVDLWLFEKGAEKPDGPPAAAPLAVFHKTDEGWRIAAFQNTPVVMREDLRGDIRALQ